MRPLHTRERYREGASMKPRIDTKNILISILYDGIIAPKFRWVSKIRAEKLLRCQCKLSNQCFHTIQCCIRCKNNELLRYTEYSNYEEQW